MEKATAADFEGLAMNEIPFADRVEVNDNSFRVQALDRGSRSATIASGANE
jgi:hypothetical protein